MDYIIDFGIPFNTATDEFVFIHAHMWWPTCTMPQPPLPSFRDSRFWEPIDIPRSVDLKKAIGGHLVKKKNAMCDVRCKIQAQVDSFTATQLI